MPSAVMKTYPATSDTIACTLGPDELGQVGSAWRRLLSRSLVSRHEVPGGLRIEVRPRGADELRRLVQVERGCCRWIAFELDGPVVTMTSDRPAGEAAIRQMWTLGG